MADIYINSDQTSPALQREGRDGLEDDLDDFLGEAGQTSGGGGALDSFAWNVDVELTDTDNLSTWIKRLAIFLRRWGVPRDTELVILPPGWVEGMEPHRVSVFPRIKPKVTRKAFLANPTALIWADGVKPDWIGAAYRQSEKFRRAIATALSESVAQRGDFGLVGGWLDLLSNSLSPQQAMDLFTRVCKKSRRSDGEWREEFEARFPGCSGAA